MSFYAGGPTLRSEAPCDIGWLSPCQVSAALHARRSKGSALSPPQSHFPETFLAMWMSPGHGSPSSQCDIHRRLLGSYWSPLSLPAKGWDTASFKPVKAAACCSGVRPPLGSENCLSLAGWATFRKLLSISEPISSNQELNS